MTRFLARNNIFYHGTYSDFDRFRPMSHFGSIYAAKSIINSGSVKYEMIDGLPKPGKMYILQKIFSKLEKKARIIPVNLNLKNTYELQDIEAIHDKSFYQSVLLFHFLKDLGHKKLTLLYDYIAKDPYNKLSWNSVKKELETDSLYEPAVGKDHGYSLEEVDRYHLFLQRLIQYFESIGFDGFHYTNHYEDNGHISYIPFRPESIIRLDLPVQNYPYNISARKDLSEYSERDLDFEEYLLLKFEDIYRSDTVEEKLSLLDCYRKTMLRLSCVKQYFIEKAYYSKVLFEDVLPNIAQITNQSRYGYHGLTHTQQVGLVGIDLALSVHQDPMPVLLAAGLHDCARTNDEYCEMHGPMCEPIARKFLKEKYPDLLPIDVERIVEAVKMHTVGINAKDLVSACLWDADRVRLSWEMGYQSKFFSTPYGKRLGSLSVKGQKKYITEQEKFLISNGIKTRDQIEYDKMMDRKQDAIGTIFKIKEK